MKIERNKFIFKGFDIMDLLYADYCDRKTLYEFMLRIRGYIKGRVLDFGCGKKPYQELFDCDEYIGIDTESSGHGWLDKSGPDVFYDGIHMPFENESFDTVLSTQVFEHVDQIDKVLNEITRVLRVGGVLVVSVPMAEEEHEKPYDFRRFTEIGIRAYLQQYGYKCIESGMLNSWSNSIRILNIARLCHDSNSNVISKVRKYGYIVHCNVHRMLFGNKVRTGQLFSNKVFCIAEKR